MAWVWVDSLRTLLHRVNQRQLASLGLPCSPLDKDIELQSKELFEAAARSDLNRLRFMFDSKVSVDLMDSTTGDIVLLLACSLHAG